MCHSSLSGLVHYGFSIAVLSSVPCVPIFQVAELFCILVDVVIVIII